MEKLFQIIITKLSFKLLFGLFQLHFLYIYIQCIEYNKSIINNIINFNEEDFRYLSFANYSNGDMIFSSTANHQTEKRIFYGFKKNGRPFFQNETSYFYSMNSAKKIRSEQKFESDSLVIKLSNENEKEYLLSTGNKESFCEIYDFKNKEIYKKSMQNFSNNSNYTGSNRNMGIFLFSNSNGHYYLFGFTIEEIIEYKNLEYFLGLPIETTYPTKKVKYNLQIHQFNTIRTFNSSNTVIKDIKIDDANSKEDGISCFITESQYIICFYLTNNNTKYYHIIAYNSELEKKSEISFYAYSHNTNSFYKWFYLEYFVLTALYETP